MLLSLSNPPSSRDTARTSTIVTQVPTAIAPPVVPMINTILAVREHAPAEIGELDTLIETLHQRLELAYARKNLLVKLLDAIQDSDAPARAQAPPGMSVVR